MNKLSYLILSILYLAFITSCSKDDSGSATPASLLQSGTWKLKSIKENGFEVSEACNLDDTFKFSTTTVERNPDKIKCDPSEDVETVTYTISADGKTLTIDAEEYKVKTLTSSTLVLEYTDSGDITIITFGK